MIGEMYQLGLFEELPGQNPDFDLNEGFESVETLSRVNPAQLLAELRVAVPDTQNSYLTEDDRLLWVPLGTDLNAVNAVVVTHVANPRWNWTPNQLQQAELLDQLACRDLDLAELNQVVRALVGISSIPSTSTVLDR